MSPSKDSYPNFRSLFEKSVTRVVLELVDDELIVTEVEFAQNSPSASSPSASPLSKAERSPKTHQGLGSK